MAQQQQGRSPGAPSPQEHTSCSPSTHRHRPHTHPPKAAALARHISHAQPPFPAPRGHAAQVDMGNMEVDYGALVWQQRLALRNAPTGYTRIVLSAADLGNFMTHPIFKQVAATAIHVSGRA